MLEFVGYVFIIVVYQLQYLFCVQVVVFVVIFVEIYVCVQYFVNMGGQGMWVFGCIFVVVQWGWLEFLDYVFGQNFFWIVVNYKVGFVFMWGQNDVQWFMCWVFNVVGKDYVVFVEIVFCMVVQVKFFVGIEVVQDVYCIMNLIWYNCVICQVNVQDVFFVVFLDLMWWFVGYLVEMFYVWNIDIQFNVMMYNQVKLMVMLVQCINVGCMVGNLMVIVIQFVECFYNYVYVFKQVQGVVVFQENIFWMVFFYNMDNFGKQIVCFVVEVGFGICVVEIGVWLICQNDIQFVDLFGCIKVVYIVENWNFWIFFFQKVMCFVVFFYECNWFNDFMQVVGNVIDIVKQVQCMQNYGFFEFIVIVVQILIYLLFISYVSYIMMMMMMRIFYG